MKKHGRCSAIFLLFYGSLFLAGCVTTPQPSPIDLVVTKTPPEKETIVFGRVNVLIDNKPANWGNCKDISFGVGGYVRCFVISVEDKVRAKKFSYFLSGDGTFYWHLLPGDYTIGEWKFISGASSLRSSYGVRFSVPEGNPVVYIGTLIVSPTRLTEKNRIEDEYDQAFQGLKNKFPEIKAEPIRKLMEFTAVVRSPIFSPDGNSILFVSNPSGNSDIFISRADGTGMKNLTNHPSSNGAARWSPDGRFIIFQSDRDGQKELYRMKPDGTGLANLTRNPADDMHVEFSPDGNHIVFYRGTPVYVIRNGEKLLSNYQNTHLVVASTDGSNQRVLVKEAEMPRWSPDGQWILYRIRPEEMRIIHPDGSGDRKVVGGTPIAWTPDSKAIFYSSVRGGFDKGANICLINVDGTGNKKCVENAVARGYWYSVDSRRFWDPSGLRIALAIERQIGVQDSSGIVVLNRQGEIIADFRERTMSDYGDQVSWSNDGKTILFSKRGGMYVMRDDGKEIRPITAEYN